MPQQDTTLDSSSLHVLSRNAVLAGLSAPDAALLRPHLHRVRLVSSQVLYEPGVPIDAVYFLEEGIASQTADTGDLGQVEVGMAGREGLVGATVLLNVRALSAQHTTMQVSGSALRMQRAPFQAAAAQSATLHATCLREVEVLLIQMAQSAACNARHDMSRRLAKWLLASFDRIDSDELPIVQEYLARMLGVRRAGVSGVVGALQKAGLIHQARGRIVLLDRPGLELRSCACYAIAKATEAAARQTPRAQADEAWA